MRSLLFLTLSLCVASTGCTGRLYTHVTKPLTRDFGGTPVSRAEPGTGDVKKFRYQVEMQWNKNGIGQIAKDAGFKSIYYADIETRSFLGIWSQVYVLVYGELAE